MFRSSRAMSFVLRGTRADIESGFPGYIPERHALVCHLCFVATPIMIFYIVLCVFYLYK